MFHPEPQTSSTPKKFLYQIQIKNSPHQKSIPKYFENFQHLKNFISLNFFGRNDGHYDDGFVNYKVEYQGIEIFGDEGLLEITKNYVFCSSFGPEIINLDVVPLEIQGSRPSKPEPKSTSNYYSPSNNHCIYRTDINKWQKIKTLGRGSFGQVTLMQFNNQNYAVKETINSNRHDQGNSNSLDQLKNEMKLLCQLSHPNIVQYHFYDINVKSMMMAMEYLSRGSLEELINLQGPLSIKRTRLYSKQILSAIYYLHNNGIIHRDIKCGNCLLSSNNLVKLSDFGMARKHIPDLEYLYDLKGTLFFMAPEIFLNSFDRNEDGNQVKARLVDKLLREFPESRFELEVALSKFYNNEHDVGTKATKGYSYPCDIWAFTITILQMLTGKPIYYWLEGPFIPLLLIKRLLLDDISEIANNMIREKLILSNSEGIFDLMDGVLVRDAGSRPTVVGWGGAMCVEYFARNLIPFLKYYCTLFLKLKE